MELPQNRGRAVVNPSRGNRQEGLRRSMSGPRFSPLEYIIPMIDTFAKPFLHTRVLFAYAKREGTFGASLRVRCLTRNRACHRGRRLHDQLLAHGTAAGASLTHGIDNLGRRRERRSTKERRLRIVFDL